MKLYKVLRVQNDKLYSPFQNYYYGELNDVLGKEFTSENFDESNRMCSSGFYATDVEGLIYSLNGNTGNKVFEVEVDGKDVKFDEYKWRWEKQTITKMLSDDETKILIQKQSDKMDWNYYTACYPVVPTEIEVDFEEIKEDVVKLLKEWDSVIDSVGDSTWNNVRNSIWNSVGNSVRDSAWNSVKNSFWNGVWSNVRDSAWNSAWNGAWDNVKNSIWNNDWESIQENVWNSAWVYMGSLFPNIKDWQGISCEEETYLFQPCVDLWNMGVIPSLNDKTWSLYVGKDMNVVYEISQAELKRQI